MKNLLGSASKIVFLILTFTACVAFIMKLLPVDQFMILTISAFSFYFSKPVTPSESVTTSKTVNPPVEK